MEKLDELNELIKSLKTNVEDNLKKLAEARTNILNSIDQFGSEELTVAEDVALRKLGHYLEVVEEFEQTSLNLKKKLDNLYEPWGELNMITFIGSLPYMEAYKKNAKHFKEEMSGLILDSIYIGLTLGFRNHRLENERV